MNEALPESSPAIESASDPEHEPNSNENLHLARGSTWEDVLGGIQLGGLLGALTFPAAALFAHASGTTWPQPFWRATFWALAALGFFGWANRRVRSLVVFDKEEEAFHDAVRLGGKVYIQATWPRESAEGLFLVRRPKGTPLGRDLGQAEETLEGRGEILLSSGERLAISDWVEESSKLPSAWSLLLARLDKAGHFLGLSLEDEADLRPKGWELKRYFVWTFSVGFTLGLLILLS